MGAQFSIQIDRSRGLIRIAMSGLFTHQAIEDFLRARHQAHAELGLPPNEHLTLNDIRGMKIQAQDVVASFRDMLAAPEYRSRRLAFVAGPTLARSQLVRALSNREAQCFEDPAVAEAWLLSEDAESRAALRRAAK